MKYRDGWDGTAVADPKELEPLNFEKLHELVKQAEGVTLIAVMVPEYKIPFQQFYLENKTFRYFLGNHNIEVIISEHMRKDQIWIVREASRLNGSFEFDSGLFWLSHQLIGIIQIEGDVDATED